MVVLSRDLGYRAVAEGVETGEKLAFFKSIGRDEAQGYLFAKPWPPDTSVGWLRQRQASGGVRTHDSLLRIELRPLPSALALAADGQKRKFDMTSRIPCSGTPLSTNSDVWSSQPYVGQ